MSQYMHTITYKGMTCVYHEYEDIFWGVIDGFEIKIKGFGLLELEDNFHKIVDALY